MSTIVHLGEGGGHCNVHADKFKKTNGILANLTKYQYKNLFPHGPFNRKKLLGPIMNSLRIRILRVEEIKLSIN